MCHAQNNSFYPEIIVVLFKLKLEKEDQTVLGWAICRVFTHYMDFTHFVSVHKLSVFIFNVMISLSGLYNMSIFFWQQSKLLSLYSPGHVQLHIFNWACLTSFSIRCSENTYHTCFSFLWVVISELPAVTLYKLFSALAPCRSSVSGTLGRLGLLCSALSISG